MLKKLLRSEPWELQAWMLSAGVTGFGLGALFAEAVASFAVWVAVIGFAIHVIMMVRIYGRNG